MDTINTQQTQGGGSATPYVIVFFLCVISVIVGYFQYTMKGLKTEEEKRDIQRKADLEIERAKIKMGTDAEKKALADREAKIKAAEAAVNKKLADATATVKNAQKLQDDAKKVKADADKKKKDADAAMAKAVASGNAVDKKLADEKKKLADQANKKVAEANKKAEAEKKKAQAEAKKALDLKKQLDKVSTEKSELTGALKYNAVQGAPVSGTSYELSSLTKSNVTKPDDCISWASDLDYPMWGYYDKTHPTKKNTCFGYKKVTAKYAGDTKNQTTIVGCTFSDLRPDQQTCTSTIPAESMTNQIKSGARYAIIGGEKRKYCSDTTDGIKCNSDTIGESEKYYITSNGDGTWSLKGGRNAQYCMRYRNASHRVICNADSGSTDLSKFKISKYAGKYVLTNIKTGSGYGTKNCKTDAEAMMRCDASASDSSRLARYELKKL